MDAVNALTVKLHRTAPDTLDVKWSARAYYDFMRPKTAIIFVESPAMQEWVSVVLDVSSMRINTADLGIHGMPTVTVQGCSSSSSSSIVAAGTNNYIVDREGCASTETCLGSFETVEAPTTSLNGSSRIHGAPNAVTVAVDVDALKSRLAVSISYSVRWNDPRPDKWMITVRNMTWRLNEKWYNECIYVVDQSVGNFQPPLWFRPGNRYQVTVRGLKIRPSSSPAAVSSTDALTAAFGQVSIDDQNSRAESYDVTCKGTAEFRAGETLSLAEMRTLHDKAVSYIQSNGYSSTNVCQRMYRNKDRSYFDKVLGDSGGWMRGYTKDPTGDLRSPINGEFSGLFFMASARMGKSNSESPFGNTRVHVDAKKLLELAPNVYFADFYCLNGKDHYVTLVQTRSGSDADRFCQQHLPRLNVHDSSNKIMFYSGAQLNVAGPVFTEVFVTEDFHLPELINAGRAEMEYNIPTFAGGSTTQGGRTKNGCCGAGCNPFNYSVPCQSSGYELF